MPLFSGSSILGQQLGSIGSLTSDMDRLLANQQAGRDPMGTGMGTMSSFGDTGMSSTLLGGQRELGGLTKEAWFGGGAGGLTKERGADLLGGRYGGAQQPGYVTGGAGGQLGSLGGEYAVLDQYDALFQSAAAQTGMPVNVLKAIAAVERGWEGTSVAGAQGIMQVMPFWGEDFGLNLQDPAQNILAGAKVLQTNYQQYGNMDMAIRAYLGFGQDAYGTTDQAYLQRVKGFLSQLDASGGSFGGGAGGGSVLGMFGQGATVHDWGEFGAESGNGLYGYGTAYGLSGTQHTGLDVAMPVGTPMFAPMGGTVVCGGTGNGPGAGGSGCGAFNDYYGQGAGRIEILMDNGVTLIFGHSSSSAVQPGQRVNAGQMIGTSGGMNSAHIHLEARVRDANMPSGWRIVDPRTVFGGGGVSPQGFAGMLGGGTGGGTTPYSSTLQGILDRVRNWNR